MLRTQYGSVIAALSVVAFEGSLGRLGNRLMGANGLDRSAPMDGRGLSVVWLLLIYSQVRADGLSGTPVFSADLWVAPRQKGCAEEEAFAGRSATYARMC